jgi:hypothetical protein
VWFQGGLEQYWVRECTLAIACFEPSILAEPLQVGEVGRKKVEQVQDLEEYLVAEASLLELTAGDLTALHTEKAH